jgi:predicted dinucleotide-binding enzyme
MNVTIFGSGKMGKAIGGRFAAAGHDITYVSKDPAHAEQTAAEVMKMARKGAKVTTARQDNVALGDVVVLALWYGTNLEVARQLGSRLAGKVVVDIANPVNQTYDGLVTAPDSSSAEDVAKAAPGAKVVKGFNTTFAGTLTAGQVDGKPLDVFIAGDDAEAKKKVAQLISDAGLCVVDSGPLSRARLIEGMQLLHILVQGSMGTGFGSTIKVLS